MKLFGAILAALGMFVVSACMPPAPSGGGVGTNVGKEQLLSAAGFRTITLKTPGQTAAFQKLPPRQLSMKVYKGKKVWVYPDNAKCGCLYMGNQTAYNAYIKAASARMISEAVKDNDSDNPYSPSSFDNMLDNDWANDPEAYGLYEDW
jgi:hypothetical protein